jgi:acetyltransferase-like isoleucine patch superfamily enzyme
VAFPFIIKGVYYRVKFNIKGENNKIIFEKNSKINNTTIFIQGNNNTLHIKENIIIKKAVFWIEDNNNTISIEKNVSIEDAHIAVTGIEKCIVIGEDSMLSEQVIIRTGDSHAIINDSGIKINNEENVIIGKHVWLGNDVTILKGVHVGDNSIIGAKSLVTKDIPESSIAVGIPAKIVKQNISWSRERYV